MKPRILAVIPARLASQRLPEKPLKDIAGKSLLQRVWEQGKKTSAITDLVVATDSEVIASLAKSFGARVEMTSPEITTGSQRVAATVRQLKEKDWTAVVNLQGDMPFISPDLVGGTIAFHLEHKDKFAMSTVATPILSEETFLSTSDVKVVVSAESAALYFTRAPAPHSRDGNRMSWTTSTGKTQEVFGFKHFGLYVFRPEVLSLYERGELSPLEAVEKLEQLRLLELGHRIGVHVVPADLTADSVEVDTPGDLAKATEIAKQSE